MIKAILIAFGLIMSFGHIIAQDVHADQDTIILQRSDSIFCFNHTIQPGQTLYGLSKLYRTSLPTIHKLNPKLMVTELGIGDSIVMPLNTKLLLNQDQVDPKHRAIVLYHVQSKETLYTIAKKWAKRKIGYIKEINNLEDKSLTLNMPLTLGWMDIRLFEKLNFDPEELEIAQRDIELASKKDTNDLNPAIIEHGKAVSIKSKSAGDQPFILHRKAKLNSIVQLYNPMTGKKIHAKVVGRIPSRNYDDNVLVVLTPYLARALKARDPSFFIKMKYTM